MTPASPTPTLVDRVCPKCGARPAFVGQDECAGCNVRFEGRALAATSSEDKPPVVFVYRPWVPWVLAVIAVAFPFLPIPFLGGIPGLALKLAVTGALIKIIRDYREGMKS